MRFSQLAMGLVAAGHIVSAIDIYFYSYKPDCSQTQYAVATKASPNICYYYGEPSSYSASSIAYKGLEPKWTLRMGLYDEQRCEKLGKAVELHNVRWHCFKAGSWGSTRFSLPNRKRHDP